MMIFGVGFNIGILSSRVQSCPFQQANLARINAFFHLRMLQIFYNSTLSLQNTALFVVFWARDNFISSLS